MNREGEVYLGLRLAKHNIVNLLSIILSGSKADLSNAPLWIQRLGAGSGAPTYKLRQLKELIEAQEEVQGDIVECGTYRGGMTAIMALHLKKLSSRKKVHTFDSFKGGIEPTGEDIGNSKNRAIYFRTFRDTSCKLVYKKLKRLGIERYVQLYEGFFEDSLSKLNATSLSLVLLDCSLYQSYRDCLHQLYPKVSPEGVMLFDDYGSSVYQGATKAVDQFFVDKFEKPHKVGSYWMVKKVFV